MFLLVMGLDVLLENSLIGSVAIKRRPFILLEDIKSEFVDGVFDWLIIGTRISPLLNDILVQTLMHLRLLTDH